MDYGKMKVAELKALCSERGIAFPSDARKAQLAEWLEAYDRNNPIEVEAVAIEDSIIPASALSIDLDGMNRAAIELDAAMDSAATALGEYGADDETIGAMQLADIRVCEDGIAAALKDVDERRKELTRLLTNPKKAIDERVKELTVPLSELRDRYADARQAVHEAGYRAQYEECCIAHGMERVLDLVPYEDFIARHGQWTSRTANPLKTQEKIADEVGRIARDWEALRGLRGSMRFYDEAEREFFATLDLNAAINKNKAVTAKQEALEAARREQEENERWRAEQMTQASGAEMDEYRDALLKQQVNAWTPEFVEVEPEPDMVPEPTAEPARTPQGREDGRRRYHFEVWLDGTEVARLKQWKNANGIGDGWTFREVRNG